jgi:hypothetical protein
MSAHAQPERIAGAPEAAEITAPGDAAHPGDALPVLAEGPVVSAVRPLAAAPSSASSAALVPAVQAAAAAAGGFLAGAAVIRLVNRRHRRAAGLVRRPRPGRPARSARGVRGRSARSGELVQIVGSRSLLVDVHLLAER